jgi:hypothetical protein
MLQSDDDERARQPIRSFDDRWSTDAFGPARVRRQRGADEVLGT